MKKTYCQPNMICINIVSQPLLTTSTQDLNVEGGEYGGTFRSRRRYDFDEEE